MKKRSNGEGSLLKLKGCRFWYAQFYRNHKQIRISTKTDVKQEALAVLRKLMHQADEGRVPVDAKKTRYSDLRAILIADYERKGNKSLLVDADGEETITGLKQLDAFFGSAAGDYTASTITSDAVRKFVAKRKEDVGSAIINRSLSCLRRMFRLALVERRVNANDVPVIQLLKEPPARKGFVERGDFERLVKLLPTHLRPLITFLYYCGVRIGEALQVDWGQVSLANRTIRLEAEQTKSGEARTLKLPSILVMMLKEIPEAERTGRVFDATNLRKEWQKACVTAGLGKLTEVEGKPYDPNYRGLRIHDLRRSAVRNLVNAGVPQTVAMKISGHKTVSVFQRYSIVSEADIEAAMSAVETKSLARALEA